MAQVKLGLKDLTPLEKVQLSRNIQNGMDENEVYPTPTPPLSVMATATVAVENRVGRIETKKNDLANEFTALGNEVTVLDGLLTQQGSYIQTASGGDETKIRSANVGVRETNAPIGALPAPQHLSVSNGDLDGHLDCHCDKVRGAGSYRWQTCTGDDPIGGTWGGDGVGTKSSITLTDFTLGTRVWVRVAAIGSAGQSPWSNPVSKIVA